MACLLVDQPINSANNDNSIIANYDDDDYGGNKRNGGTNNNDKEKDQDKNNNSSNSNNNNNNNNSNDKKDDDYDGNHRRPPPIFDSNSTGINDSSTGILPVKKVGAKHSSYFAAIVLTFGLTVVTAIGLYRLLQQRSRLLGREHYIAI